MCSSGVVHMFRIDSRDWASQSHSAQHFLSPCGFLDTPLFSAHDSSLSFIRDSCREHISIVTWPIKWS